MKKYKKLTSQQKAFNEGFITRRHPELLIWLEIRYKIDVCAVCTHLLRKYLKATKIQKLNFWQNTFSEGSYVMRLHPELLVCSSLHFLILLFIIFNHVLTNALILILTHFVTILWNSLSHNNLLFRSFVRRSQSLWSSSLFFILEQSWSRMSWPEHVIKKLIFKIFSPSSSISLINRKKSSNHCNQFTTVHLICPVSDLVIKRCFIKFIICVPTPTW